MSKKTALEQALLESKQIVQIVTDNTRDMLYAQLKPELEKTIKESLELDNDDKDLDDAPVAEPKDTDVSIDSEPVAEPTIDSEPSGLPTDDDKPADSPMDAPVGDVDGIDAIGGSDDDNEIDLTGASDDEVIKVFKKLPDDSEIKIVKTADGINIEKDGEEYVVKLQEDVDSVYSQKPSVQEDKMDFVDALSEDDEVLYEIVMDDEASAAEPEPNNEPTLDEVARTHSDGRHQLRKPEGFYKYAESRLRPALKEEAEKKVVINEATQLKNENVKLINEAVQLKDSNSKLITENTKIKNELDTVKKDIEAHKEVLRKQKEILLEVALVNSQMNYANRLFCEHATTLPEKKAIIERFSATKSMDESKTLFKTISNEMKNVKVSIQEEIESKINDSVNGSTGEPLTEAVSVQVSESQKKIDRMKYLMGSSYYK